MIAPRGLLASALLAPVWLGSCHLVLGDFDLVEGSVEEEGGLGTACLPNSFRCNGATLEACRPTRTGFDPVSECVEPEVCDPTAGTCRACVPMEWACNGAELVQCGADGRWGAGTNCGSPALCTVSADRMLGTCEMAKCLTAGAFSCQGTRLVRCNDDLDGYSLIEDCGDVALCDAAFAEEAEKTGAPHCTAAPCGDSCGTPACDQPGVFRCAPGEVPRLEVCGTDRQFHEIEVCAHRALCNAEQGRCLPPACALRTRRCLGQVLQTCSSDRTRFTGDEACPEGTTCTPEGCDPNPCTEGAVRCNHLSFERCVGGRFVAEHRCVSPELCDTESSTCLAPLCGPLDQPFQCEDEILRICSPGRNGWDEFDTCTDGEVCDDQNGVCQIP